MEIQGSFEKLDCKLKPQIEFKMVNGPGILLGRIIHVSFHSISTTLSMY